MPDTTPNPKDWSPDSWRSRPLVQQPRYDDPAAVEEVAGRLSRLPPLVTSWEIESLREQLAAAARGERFLLQGGDCAESFEDCRSDAIASKLKILLQMSLVLIHGIRKPVTRVGRFAGQYAKPRSDDVETVGGVTLPTYRGDLVNSIEPTAEARRPDPERMLRGYERSALTLNFIRGLIDGGFADLHHPEYWQLGFVEHSPLAAEYQRMVEAVAESVAFMETLAGRAVGQLERVDFFTSHEALLLAYEEAQIRRVPRRPGWYLLSTHLPWIGMRTADPEGAHVELCRGLRNPIGVKVGPAMTAERLVRLVERLDPGDEPGRLVLIHRFGAGEIAGHLPGLLAAVRETGRTPLWVCDPMHGNTERTAAGLKTRRFEAILEEVDAAIEIHQAAGRTLGGIHVELTGEDVTECTGGARGLDEAGLGRAYRSFVDPRLNYEQALEMAMLIARRLAAPRAGRPASRPAEPEAHPAPRPRVVGGRS